MVTTTTQTMMAHLQKIPKNVLFYDMFVLLTCPTLASLAMTYKTMSENVYTYARDQAQLQEMEPTTEELSSDLLFALSYFLNQRAPCTTKPFEFGDDTHFRKKWDDDAQYFVSTRYKKINEEGELQTWGNGFQGGLGHGDQKHRQMPTKVEGLGGKKAWKVFMGPYHTVVITTDGKVYTWGMNDEGQLGQGKTLGPILKPEVVLGLEGHRVVDVALDKHSTVFLTSKGEVFVTGENLYDDLGTFDEMYADYELCNYWNPTKMTDLKGKAVAISRPKMHWLEVYVSGLDDKELNKKKRRLK